MESMIVLLSPERADLPPPDREARGRRFPVDSLIEMDVCVVGRSGRWWTWGVVVWWCGGVVNKLDNAPACPCLIHACRPQMQARHLLGGNGGGLDFWIGEGPQ